MSESLPQPRLTHHPHGITAVDAELIHPGLAAAHVVAHGGRAAFVDVGTTYSTPYLLAALGELGIAREAVDYVFLTHVHLDHAGGAGSLMRMLPNARAVVHPRGAPHLIEPSKLVTASTGVYGEALFRRLYGDIVPIPAQRVVLAQDLQRFSLAGREFELIHTPGHALHHYSAVDIAHANVFTGDTFGLSYRELDTANGAFIIPSTTPSQFDPDQLIASVDRVMSYAPQAVYLTHYSRVTDVPRLAQILKEQIRELERLALRHAAAADPKAAIHADMHALWLDLARRHGCTLPQAQLDELLWTDLELNAQGLVAWLKRVNAPKSAAARPDS